LFLKYFEKKDLRFENWDKIFLLIEVTRATENASLVSLSKLAGKAIPVFTIKLRTLAFKNIRAH
jgi:hypothetical protein